MGGSYPSFDDILKDGAPPEWAPFVFISGFISLGMLALDIYVLIQHKKYSTKFPIQFLCTVGILQVYPFFAIMQFVGLVVPNAMDMLLFLTEACEALSFIFFLKLVLTYMGGKKASKSILKGEEMHLNIPPICCFICLPTIKFTRKFFIFCELLIGIYAFYCIFVGFVELVVTLDGSESYPASAISDDFATAYHMILLLLLFLAIYGLSGIYHSAEDKLNHRGIIKKFLVYKIFTLLVKLEDVILGTLAHHNVINNDSFAYNKNFDAGLRIRNIYGFIVVIEALIAFPLAIRFYSTSDYIETVTADDKVLENTDAGEKEEKTENFTDI